MENELLDITNRIYIIRDQKVMLDRDLAELYGVEVKVLNQAVKRNVVRFPEEFCFAIQEGDRGGDIYCKNIFKFRKEDRTGFNCFLQE